MVTGAAGSVGQAACQLAMVRGARVLGVVREGQDLPGIEAVVSSGDIPKQVHELTNGHGEDVCLDTVSGPSFRLFWRRWRRAAD